MICQSKIKSVVFDEDHYNPVQLTQGPRSTVQVMYTWNQTDQKASLVFHFCNSANYCTRSQAPPCTVTICSYTQFWGQAIN